MSIIIKTRKEVLSSGIEGRRIKKLIALKNNQLPLAYFNFTDNVFLSDNENRLYCRKCEVVLEVGYFYEENIFQKKLEFIKKSGDRLKDINDQLKEMRKNWRGKETFII